MAKGGVSASKRPTSDKPVTATGAAKPLPTEGRPAFKHHGAISVVVIAIVVGVVAYRKDISLLGRGFAARSPPAVPALAQVINQKAFNVLGTVPPPSEAHGTSVSSLANARASSTHSFAQYFIPTGKDQASLKASRFISTMTTSIASSGVTPKQPIDGEQAVRSSGRHIMSRVGGLRRSNNRSPSIAGHRRSDTPQSISRKSQLYPYLTACITYPLIISQSPISIDHFPAFPFTFASTPPPALRT
jgi:hypothetical protein